MNKDEPEPTVAGGIREYRFRPRVSGAPGAVYRPGAFGCRSPGGWGCPLGAGCQPKGLCGPGEIGSDIARRCHAWRLAAPAHTFRGVNANAG